MKIGPQDSPLNADAAGSTSGASGRLGAETRAALARASGVGSALAAATGQTEVRLSAVATTALASVASTGGDVDMEKVRRVQQALANGSYQINPEAIADELIAHAQHFLPSKG